MSTNSAKITVELSAEAEAQVIERAASILSASVRAKAKEKLDESMQTSFDESWHGTLEQMTADTIRQHLTTPRSICNRWGEELGKDKETIADQIPAICKAYLAEKVNSRGERQGYGDKYPTRLQWLVGTVVKAELDKETRKAVDEVTEQARKVVSQHVARFVAREMVDEPKAIGNLTE